MILNLTLFIAVISILGLSSSLASPQVQYRYGVPARAAPVPFPAVPPAVLPLSPFPSAPPAPPPPPPAPLAPRVLPVQEDPSALELLPPLQHVVGTRYPSVSPGKGYRFPLSQLLNPTPPPNLKH